jgi:transcriptional regulator with XRE-family HTH domain
MLSKIERGRLFPTLPTLLRIALVFGVGLEFFFAGAREKPLVAVVRKKDPRTAARASRRARQCLPLRVAQLSGHRAALQLLLR